MKSEVPAKTTAAESPKAPAMLDMLFAGGSTLVFLTLLASLAGSLTFYFR